MDKVLPVKNEYWDDMDQELRQALISKTLNHLNNNKSLLKANTTIDLNRYKSILTQTQNNTNLFLKDLNFISSHPETLQNHLLQSKELISKLEEKVSHLLGGMEKLNGLVEKMEKVVFKAAGTSKGDYDLLVERSGELQGIYGEFVKVEAILRDSFRKELLDKDTKLIRESLSAASVMIGLSKVEQVQEKKMLTSELFKKDDFSFYPVCPVIQSYRKDLPIPHGRCFTIDCVLSEKTCEDLISHTEKLGYDSLDAEFESSFRNNDRVLVINPKLANALWKSIAPYFKRKDIFRMIPIGFGNEGIWRPVRLNECIKFNKYLSGTYFLPHIDGPWIPKWDEASIFTVVFYLNDNFTGGETQFLEGNDLVIKSEHHNCNILATVKPKKGSCLIFNHDLLHQSTMVMKGVKYIARTEVIFEKIDSNMMVNPLEYASDPNYLKFITLYKSSQEEYQKGNPGQFMDLYYEALKLQVEAMRKSIPKHLPLSKTAFPEEIWLIILQEFSFQELLTLMAVSKGMKEVVLDGELWRSRYQKSFPKDYKESLNIHPSMEDWYTKFKIRKLTEYVNNMKFDNQFGVIDIGTSQLKYGSYYENGINCVPSKCQVKKIPKMGYHYRAYSTHKFGVGEDLMYSEGNCWYFNRNTLGILQHLRVCSFSLIYLRTPINLKHTLPVTEVDMSVAALRSYFRDSGLVISLGATFYWIQQVVNNKVLFSYLQEKKDKENLVEVITDLIKKWKDWKESIQEDRDVVECCCIGGKCDKSNVEVIKSRIEMEGYKVNIISDVEKRITGPLMGVYTRKKWDTQKI